MPRDITKTYSLPAGSIVAPGDDIEAQQHNTPLIDLQEDNNAPRPIAAGGTEASNAAEARVNLGAAGLEDDNDFTGVNTFTGTTSFLRLKSTSSDVSGGDGACRAGVSIVDGDDEEVMRFGKYDSSIGYVRNNVGSMTYDANQLGLNEGTDYFHEFKIGGTNQLSIKETGIEAFPTITGPRLRLTATSDASAGSTSHAFQVGITSATHLKIDNNEVIAVNGTTGLLASLFVNGLRNDSPAQLGDGTNASTQAMYRQNADARYQNSSLSKLKDNKLPAYDDALAILGQLEPKTWTWNDNLPSHDEKIGRQGAGLVVEDVLNIMPEAIEYQWNDDGVDGTDEGASQSPRGLDAMAFIALLIAGTKQQQAQIETLTARLDALEGANE